jgi:hypothetical protein
MIFALEDGPEFRRNNFNLRPFGIGLRGGLTLAAFGTSDVALMFSLLLVVRLTEVRHLPPRSFE